jgi:adenylosuccinate synthase
MPHGSAFDVLVVALSGPVCAGKTTLAGRLADGATTSTISTRQILMSRREAAECGHRRTSLQDLGDRLDRTTGGTWLADAVRPLLGEAKSHSAAVIDAIRTTDQLRALKRISRVVHVHLTASDSVLRARFAMRAACTSFEPAQYDAVLRGSEILVSSLRAYADLVVDTAQLDVDVAYISARRFLDLYPGFRAP